MAAIVDTATSVKKPATNSSQKASKTSQLALLENANCVQLLPKESTWRLR
jgi:hypothetical protein